MCHVAAVPHTSELVFEDRELLRHRLRATASRMSIEVIEEFDDLPDPIDEFNDEANFGVG